MNTPFPPNNETVINVNIRADSLASLRDQLQKALDEMGWAPQQVAQAAKLAELVVEAEEAVAPAPAPDAVEKPKRTRKAKEEAPAVPALGPTIPSTSPAPVAEPSAPATPSAEPGPTSSVTTAAPTSPSTPAAKSSGPTHEQAKAAAEKWMASHPDGPVVAKTEVRGILATFGVSKVAELSPTDIPAFLSELDGDV